MAVMVWCTVALLTQGSAAAVKHIRHKPTPPRASWFIGCSHCSLWRCLRCFLRSWKSGSFWSCVSVWVPNSSDLRECRAWSFLAALTSHLCVAINWNDLQAPVVLQYELSISEKKTKKNSSLFNGFPRRFGVTLYFLPFFSLFVTLEFFCFF